MNDLSPELESKLVKITDYCREGLTQIRTGHASPALIEGIIVEAYDGTAKLKVLELATISTEGSSNLVVTPFDGSVLPEIQKAISNSPLGLSSSVQGPLIRVSIPPLSEEQRERYVKLASQKVEEGKEQMRTSRDESRRQIKASFENKQMSEDERHSIEKNVDELVKKYSDSLEEMKKKKQAEIMNI